MARGTESGKRLVPLLISSAYLLSLAPYVPVVILKRWNAQWLKLTRISPSLRVVNLIPMKFPSLWLGRSMLFRGVCIHNRVMAELVILELPAMMKLILAVAVATVSHANAEQSRLQLNGKCMGMFMALQQWQLMNGFLWQTVLCLTVGH